MASDKTLWRLLRFGGRPALTGDPRVPPSSRFEEYKADGYAFFLMAGIRDAGKTELLRSYGALEARTRGSSFLLAESLQSGPTTGPPRLFPVEGNGRRMALVDASGEDFQRILPPDCPDQVWRREELRFLEGIAMHLGGLVLLLDLTQLWDGKRQRDGQTQPDGHRQIEILTGIVSLVRWLRDNRLEGRDAIPKDLVSRGLGKGGRRLRQPVLVLFSMADKLGDVTIPNDVEGIPRADGVSRRVDPATDSPLDLARHCLPVLYAMLARHCRHFRFDFVRSQVEDLEKKLVASSCGIQGSFAWLLDPRWRWPPGLPSRFWISWERRRARRQRGYSWSPDAG